MRLFLLLLFTFFALNATDLKVKIWQNGHTYLNFLEDHKLPIRPLYYNLDREDQKLTEEVFAGTRYEVLYHADGTVSQALIPINENLQIQIYQRADKSYGFQTTPLLLDSKREAFTFELRTSPYNDIMHYTNNRFLAQEFVWAFKNSLNFKTDLRKGDRIVVVYTQNYRRGERFGYPTIEVAMIEVFKKPHYIYRNSDGRYYNDKGKEIEGFMLANAVKNARITSRFTYRRFHPILKRYRAHLGIDFGARPGTPIYAAAKGRVIFKGSSRGYGNYIKIAHIDGYITLYAHMRSFKKGVNRGSNVTTRSVIGYVGTSGLSTGPHLHFSLYKNGRALNPLGVIRVTTNQLRGKKLQAFQALQTILNREIELHKEANTQPQLVKVPEMVCYLGANTAVSPLKKEE